MQFFVFCFFVCFFTNVVLLFAIVPFLIVMQFWWEMIVLVRKYAIILLVTFNNKGKFQLHMALGLIIVALHLHDSQHPFGHRHVDPTNAVLHRYEMGSLLILLFMLWCADFFALELCDTQNGWCEFMVVVVLGSNFGLVAVLIVLYVKEWLKRNHIDETISNFVHSKLGGRFSVRETADASGGEMKTETNGAIQLVSTVTFSGENGHEIGGGGAGTERAHSASLSTLDLDALSNPETKIYVNPLTPNRTEDKKDGTTNSTDQVANTDPTPTNIGKARTKRLSSVMKARRLSLEVEKEEDVGEADDPVADGESHDEEQEWVRALDSSSGDWYLYNVSTNETKWE